MKNLIPLCAFLLVTSFTTAQVGIGTATPSSELEIVTSNAGIPALELNPQANPIGSEMGQMAVIGDKLYTFDSNRRKWLSVEANAYTWTSNGNTDNTALGIGTLTTLDSGTAMPLDGTIVYVAATSSGGVATKGFDVLVRNGAATLSTNSFNLVANSYNNSNWDVDFSAGDYLSVFCQGALGQVTDPSVTVWVKWRE